jgi:mannitol/fructose-specific phosphotransferase system IIA component (Ntr-type)
MAEEFSFLLGDAALRNVAASRNDLLREMVRVLAVARTIPSEDRESVFQAIVAREQLGATVIAGGIAIPHTRHPAVARTVGVVAGSEAGIDFQSPDGRPVHLVVLLVSPAGQPAEHLQAMQHIARFLRSRTGERPLPQRPYENR